MVIDRTANSFTTTQSRASCANSSAEWIAEAPCCTSSGGILPLANFGTWTLSNATVTGNGTSSVISSFTNVKITMTGCQVSALNSSGNGFTVTCKPTS